MFSKYIHILLNQIQFLLQILKRFFIILFRKRRNIHLLHLNYSDKHLFSNSIIIINYRFRNAIYYKFGNRSTVENQIKLFNVEKIKPEIKLTVYGFFRKQDYSLKFEPENILIASTFKTEFSNLTAELVSKPLPQHFSNDFTSETSKINVNLSDVMLTIKPIKPKHNSFNQTDFL